MPQLYLPFVWQLFPKKIAVCMIVALTGIQPSFSISAEVDPKQCKELASNMERLDCYDGIFVGKKRLRHSNTDNLLQKQTTSSNPLGSWQIDVRKSLMDDTDVVILKLNSKHIVKGPFGRPKRPALFIACNEGLVSFWLHMGSYVTDFYSGGRVSYRLDQSEIRNVEMRESVDQRAIGLWDEPQSRAFIREIAGGNKLTIRLTPVESYQVTFTFNLTGLERALAPVEIACSASLLRQG